jgi:micrococcal nuclease
VINGLGAEMSNSHLNFLRLFSPAGWRLLLALIASLPAAAIPAAELSASKPPVGCTLEPGPIRTVSRILDAETVELDDGSSVRLIGALAPRSGDAGAAPGTWPAELNAIRLLTTLTLGQNVKLAYGGRHTDRYGRHLAHLFLNSSGVETWVQGALLAAGAARAYGLPGNGACLIELLAHERIARDQRLGIWETAVYRPKPARLAALLISRRSRFEIVEGPVTSVSRSKSGVYLSFGADWKTDFTARIAKDVLAANPVFDQSLSDMTGKQVTVRGWIERRNGPMIDIRNAAQIQFKDGAADSKALSEATAPSASENASTTVTPETPLHVPAVPALEPRSGKRPAIPVSEKPSAVDL